MKLALALSAALAGSLAAPPLMALSCMEPDPVRLFAELDDSDQEWTIVWGFLQYETDYEVPDVMEMSETPGRSFAPIPARIDGAGLSAEGFVRPYAGPIQMQPVCYGPWCGGLPGPGAGLHFLKVEPQGLVLLLDPCGQYSHPPPDPALQAALAACIAGDPCLARD
jgi:hypothetical protein